MQELTLNKRMEFALAGGDDYELLFTAPADQHEWVMQAASDTDTPVTLIGEITYKLGLNIIDAQGVAISRRFASFNHFSS